MGEGTNHPEVVSKAHQHVTAVLGAGVMGRTLLAGLLRAGWPASSLMATARRVQDRHPELIAHDISFVTNAQAAQVANTLVIAVKPQDADALLSEIRDHITSHCTVISMMAGISTSWIEQRLPAGSRVIRAMPNTPALVDQGMTAISGGAHCEPEDLAIAEDIVRATGKVVTVPEHYQDAVTAISGSGPAYVFYVVEAMIEAGVLLGLPRATSTDLVVQTVLGAATMLSETKEHPTVLREQVSSPAGTTMAALRQLDDHKVRAAFLTAIEAACERSRSLSEGRA